MYRFAYLFIVETNISVEIIDTELTEKILGNVLRLVDITKQEHYAEIPNLDKLAEHIAKLLDEDCGCDGRQEWLNEKTKDWSIYKKRNKGINGDNK